MILSSTNHISEGLNCTSKVDPTVQMADDIQNDVAMQFYEESSFHRSPEKKMLTREIRDH